MRRSVRCTWTVFVKRFFMYLAAATRAPLGSIPDHVREGHPPDIRGSVSGSRFQSPMLVQDQSHVRLTTQYGLPRAACKDGPRSMSFPHESLRLQNRKRPRTDLASRTLRLSTARASTTIGQWSSHQGTLGVPWPLRSAAQARSMSPCPRPSRCPIMTSNR